MYLSIIAIMAIADSAFKTCRTIDHAINYEGLGHMTWSDQVTNKEGDNEVNYCTINWKED